MVELSPGSWRDVSLVPAISRHDAKKRTLTCVSPVAATAATAATAAVAATAEAEPTTPAAAAAAAEKKAADV